MKASEVYTGYGARNIVYQIWPVVADGFERASGGDANSRSDADHLVLHAAEAQSRKRMLTWISPR
jgi:hypothetical protein